MKTLATLATATALTAASPALAQNYAVETLADSLDRPWAMTFLPNGDVVEISVPAGKVPLEILEISR